MTASQAVGGEFETRIPLQIKKEAYPRYVITPGKKADPADESGKRKIEFLTVTVWPGPWSVEHTAEEKIRSAEFEGSQAGLDAAVAWLHECYKGDMPRWTNIPSILDCEPDR